MYVHVQTMTLRVFLMLEIFLHVLLFPEALDCFGVEVRAGGKSC